MLSLAGVNKLGMAGGDRLGMAGGDMCWVCRLQAMCFLLYMAQSDVLINNKDLIPPNLCVTFIYI